MPELPTDLVASLLRARELEAAADNLSRRRAAVGATGALMLAAARAGWHGSDLSRAIGLGVPAGQARIRSARARGAGGGLDVQNRVRRQPSVLQVLATPVEGREWLSADEAADYAGQSIATIGSWRRGGLLPNTDRRARSYPLHLRADLDRVIRAPRHLRHGVDHNAVRRQIRESSV